MYSGVESSGINVSHDVDAAPGFISPPRQLGKFMLGAKCYFDDCSARDTFEGVDEWLLLCVDDPCLGHQITYSLPSPCLLASEFDLSAQARVDA